MKYRLLKNKNVTLKDGSHVERAGDVFDGDNVAEFHGLDLLLMSRACEPVTDEPVTKEIRQAPIRKGKQ